MLKKSVYWKMYVFVFICRSSEFCKIFVLTFVLSELFNNIYVKGDPNCKILSFFPNWMWSFLTYGIVFGCFFFFFPQGDLSHRFVPSSLLTLFEGHHNSRIFHLLPREIHNNFFMQMLCFTEKIHMKFRDLGGWKY